MVDIVETIWEDFESLLIENQNEKQNEKQNGECTKKCVHYNKQTVQKEGIQVCLDCGEIIQSRIFETCEWNNYKSDDGSTKNSSQRGDLYVSDNPYDISGTIPGINKNSFMMRIHYQQTFSHKQKTFWKISEKFEHYCALLKIHTSILGTTKNMWHICMESGKLTRASVRNGLIASCLYYACIHNNMPADRQAIIDVAEGNQKGFLKGEKIFLEIMETSELYKNLGKEKINIKENDSFYKFCNELALPFKTAHLCNEIYTKHINDLDSVTPKSIIAGILFYVVKNVLKLKQPSKSKISTVVNVCIPTINKVVLILETLSK